MTFAGRLIYSSMEIFKNLIKLFLLFPVPYCFDLTFNFYFWFKKKKKKKEGNEIGGKRKIQW